MNQRIWSVWLPGLVTGTLSMGLLWLLEAAGVQARVLWLNDVAMMFSLPWTLSLPIIGALGAWSSRAQGGRARECLLAGLFPSVSLAMLFVVGFSLVSVFGKEPAPPSAAAVNVLGWVILPGLALLAGVLPIVLAQRRGFSADGAGDRDGARA